MLLIYLTGREEDKRNTPGEKVFRSWKGYKFEILDGLENRGLIRQIFSDATGKNVDQASLFSDAVSPEGDAASILFIQHQRMVMEHQRMVMEHQQNMIKIHSPSPVGDSASTNGHPASTNGDSGSSFANGASPSVDCGSIKRKNMPSPLMLNERIITIPSRP